MSPISLRLLGSSPLARGALFKLLHTKVAERLIPAGAGSTSPFLFRTVSAWAHPRWRGEHPIV